MRQLVVVPILRCRSVIPLTKGEYRFPSALDSSVLYNPFAATNVIEYRLFCHIMLPTRGPQGRAYRRHYIYIIGPYEPILFFPWLPIREYTLETLTTTKAHYNLMFWHTGWQQTCVHYSRSADKFPHNQLLEIGIQIPVIRCTPRPRSDLKRDFWMLSTDLDKIIGRLPAISNNYKQFMGAIVSAAKKSIPNGFRKNTLQVGMKVVINCTKYIWTAAIVR